MKDGIRPLFQPPAARAARVAILMSGSGSNAERVIERLRACQPVLCEVAALATDAPETSRARELGRRYDIPVVEHDIRRFYADHGETRVSIATPRGRELRERWTDGLRQRLAPHAPDFAIFAGFVPLTNLTNDTLCLNVHPGDLTERQDGRRILVGLHTVPIERAILAGLESLRSSVIQALPYTGGDDMDNGPILGISAPVPVDLHGVRLETLQEQAAARPERRPKDGFGDDLERIARANQENLKVHGDWVVLPPVVIDVATGRFGTDAAGGLYIAMGRTWHPIETVVYSPDGSREVLFRDPQA